MGDQLLQVDFAARQMHVSQKASLVGRRSGLSLPLPLRPEWIVVSGTAETDTGTGTRTQALRAPLLWAVYLQ